MTTTNGTRGEIWRVGGLVIDVGRQRVTRDDQSIELPPLSFELLLTLVRGAPSVVSNDVLMSQVWPGIVVSPETLSQRVMLLRRALGDSAREPRYIAGQRGRGYRLVAEAVREDDAFAGAETTPAPVPTAAGAPNPSHEQPSSQLRAPRLAALLLAAALLLGIIAWRAHWSGDAIVAPTEAARTVAVLPFRNLSPDPENAFIALGLPEAVLDRLATVQGLTVVARHSAFHVGEGVSDIREVGRRLGAGYLVDGSVQRQGDSLRVTARLIDARDNAQIWSTRYDRRIGELFALQDEIAAAVAASLQARIAGMQGLQFENARTPDIEAYLAWLRGRTLIGRYTVWEADAAAAEFERAIAHDPQFAAAYAALYDARMQSAALQLEDPTAARQRFAPLLERALALDPDSGAAQFARAMWEDADNAVREQRFRDAMQRDPSNSRGITAFAEFLDAIDGRANAGRVRGSGFLPQAYGAAVANRLPGSETRAQEAARLLERAITIDPLSLRAHFRRVQRSFDTAGSVDPGMQSLLAIDPEYYPALQRVGLHRWLLHDSPSEALTLLERAIAADPLNPWARQSAVIVYLDLGELAAAREVADGAAGSRITAAPVLALAAGDPRSAGRAAELEESLAFGFHESWLSSQSLRDAALLDHRYASAERLLAARYDMSIEGPDRVTIRNFRATVQLAHLQLAQGRSERARQMLEAVIAWIDADETFGTVYMKRTRAQALMLLGRKDEALRYLAASFEVDKDHTEWWYTLERDPVWSSVREEPEFQALAAEARSFLARERAAVEAARARGEIPRRPGHTDAQAGP